MRTLACALLFGVFALVGRDAAADVASEARFFDELGRKAYEAGDYAKALESFQLLQEIAPSVGVLYNIALCADLAGRRDMAFSLYGEYLKAEDPDGKRRADAEQRVERLKGKLALVMVETDPPGAAVYVDRKELGLFGVTPVTLALPEGQHRLLVEQRGFKAGELPVEVRTGSLARAKAKLTPLFGRLVVNVTPGTTRLRFWRDGLTVTPKMGRGGYELQVGNYTIVANAPGHAPAERHVVVAESQTGQLDLGLAPLPRATGVLLVTTGTTAAEVFVDGKRVAMTPATLSGLEVGAHALEVRAGTRSVRRSITITQGKATYLELDLGEAP
jgi:hypothetical protein